MTEPKVEFDLNNMTDEVREQFDQFRRWYEFREDNQYPAIQTFSGILEPSERRTLNLVGDVFGAVGYTTGIGGYWRPMEVSASLANAAHFWDSNPGSTNARAVEIRGGSNTDQSYSYRVTVFYRD